MAYFEDLTPYTYFRKEANPRDLLRTVLNVGWLDADHAFPTADADQLLINALEYFHERQESQTRGWHNCPFCSMGHLKLYGKHFSTAEIRIRDAGLITYAAPAMILHYVREHRYSPPPEFIATALVEAKVMS